MKDEWYRSGKDALNLFGLEMQNDPNAHPWSGLVTALLVIAQDQSDVIATLDARIAALEQSG